MVMDMQDVWNAAGSWDKVRLSQENTVKNVQELFWRNKKDFGLKKIEKISQNKMIK